MERKTITTHEPVRRGLEHCTGCHQPFVVPAALLDYVDEGLYLLAMECRNCGRLTAGVEEDAELERLEDATRHATAQIRAALKQVHELP